MGERAAFFAQPGLKTVSRRAILQGGVAVLALGLNPSFSKSAVMPTDHRPDLFAFRAPSSKDSVFAVVFPVDGASSVNRPGAVVHIHAGRRSWALPITSDGVTTLHHARAFVGQIRFPADNSSTTRIAVVLETPTSFARPGESLDVWAELRCGDGSRSRVGSPLVAEIVARNPSLSEVYHKITPDRDRAVLSDIFAASLASRSFGSEDPETRGRRLASMLLPDVIRYEPGAPIGFNFAARNGRHPSDPSHTVAETVIAGVVVPGRRSAAVKLASEFPYFPTAGAIS